MECPSCGEQMRESDGYCHSCDTSLSDGSDYPYGGEPIDFDDGGDVFEGEGGW